MQAECLTTAGAVRWAAVTGDDVTTAHLAAMSSDLVRPPSSPAISTRVRYRGNAMPNKTFWEELSVYSPLHTWAAYKAKRPTIPQRIRSQVTLRPTVSRPVLMSGRPPSGTRDRFFFLLDIFFRHLWVCYFVAPSLTRGRVEGIRSRGKVFLTSRCLETNTFRHTE
jgi:hypothetical protein